MIIAIAAIIGAQAAIKSFPHTSSQAPAQQTQIVPLALGEKEYQEFGLPKTATHQQLWEAVRQKPLPVVQLCAQGETILITHSMGSRDIAAVNGAQVDTSGNGYTLIRIPAGTTQLTITGVRTAAQDGRIVFVIDDFSNSMLSPLGATNACDLKESHNAVAVRAGETINIPIVR